MADETKVRELVGLAIAAAGPIGSNEIGWKMRVEQAIPAIASMLSPRSRASDTAERMLDATMLPPSILESVQLEESTQRMLVRLAGEEHPLRSDHTKSARGRAMADKLRSIPIGSRVLVWRFNEPLKNDPKKTSRVLVHIEQLPTFNTDVAAPSAHPAPGRVEGRQPASVAADDPPSAGDRGEPFQDQASVFDAQDPPLTSQQMVRVVQRCRALGIANPAFPAPEDLDRVLVVISEETRT